MEEKAGATLAAEQLKQFIGFTVGEEEFGIELLHVKEVIRIREITRLPGTPACVRGIINLRGDVIPLVDLREKFGLEAKEYGGMTRVIVVEVEGSLVGMVVDSASQVVRISSEEIEPPPPVLGRRSTEYVTGVGKRDGKLMILVDALSIFTSEEVEGMTRTAAEAVAVSAQGGGR